VTGKISFAYLRYKKNFRVIASVTLFTVNCCRQNLKLEVSEVHSQFDIYDVKQEKIFSF